MHLEGVAKIVIGTSKIEAHILPDLAAAMDRDELGPFDIDALSIEENGFDFFLEDGQGMRDLANKSLSVKIDLKIEVHVARFGLLNIGIRARVN